MKRFCRMKKFLYSFICILLLSLALAPAVPANSAPTPDYLHISLSNVTEDVVFADILIQMSADDENYVSLNESNVELYKLPIHAEILDYAQDGFCSFTFHYKNSLSSIRLHEGTGLRYDYVDFCTASQDWDYSGEQYDDLLNNYKEIKIALLDVNGSILSVSDAFSINENSSFFRSFSGNLKYDTQAKQIERQYTTNSVSIFLAGIGLLLVLIFMFFSVGLEVLTALLFRFKGKQLLVIFITNLITQIGMRTLHLFIPLPYLANILLLEALVYTTEFFVYKKFFKDVKTSKILLYTVTANTVSLVLGFGLYIFLRMFIIF